MQPEIHKGLLKTCFIFCLTDQIDSCISAHLIQITDAKDFTLRSQCVITKMGFNIFLLKGGNWGLERLSNVREVTQPAAQHQAAAQPFISN